jgi:hypothetical protein
MERVATLSPVFLDGFEPEEFAGPVATVPDIAALGVLPGCGNQSLTLASHKPEIEMNFYVTRVRKHGPGFKGAVLVTLTSLQKDDGLRHLLSKQ